MPFFHSPDCNNNKQSFKKELESIDNTTKNIRNIWKWIWCVAQSKCWFHQKSWWKTQLIWKSCSVLGILIEMGLHSIDFLWPCSIRPDVLRTKSTEHLLCIILRLELRQVPPMRLQRQKRSKVKKKATLSMLKRPLCTGNEHNFITKICFALTFTFEVTCESMYKCK